MPELFSDHLGSLAAFRASPTEVQLEIARYHRRFAAITASVVASIAGVCDFLGPLQPSIPTRWALLSHGDWTLFLDNVARQGPIALATEIGRRLSVEWFGLRAWGHSRWWIHGEGAEQKRTVYAQKEGARWVFFQDGETRDYENVLQYSRRRRDRRLTVDCVLTYATRAMGLTFPVDWASVSWEQSILLERDTASFREQPLSFDLICDV